MKMRTEQQTLLHLRCWGERGKMGIPEGKLTPVKLEGGWELKRTLLEIRRATGGRSWSAEQGRWS